MRSRGIIPSTIVQAERQGPSMTTDSPELRSDCSLSRYEPIRPPGSELMRTVADAGTSCAAKMVAASSAIDTRMDSPFHRPLIGAPDAREAFQTLISHAQSIMALSFPAIVDKELFCCGARVRIC